LDDKTPKKKEEDLEAKAKIGKALRRMTALKRKITLLKEN